mmetsp:Transcript_27358/g.82084  ORF Transcript_27358/g.82084 Transcript_27358/m.82084 type:complete len:186 (+) Transcript_27358:216-773(+)
MAADADEAATAKLEEEFEATLERMAADANEAARAPLEGVMDAQEDTTTVRTTLCGPRACDATDDAIVDALRIFIAARYDQFARSELTFRMLKQHLSDELDVPYEAFALPDGRYGDTLDDEVDAIAVRCAGGQHPGVCVFVPDYVPPAHHMRQRLTYCVALMLGLIAARWYARRKARRLVRGKKDK